jgi:hypothetical protein
MRHKYDNEISGLMIATKELDNKQQELKRVVCEKISCDNKYSIDNLVNFINADIMQLNQDRQKLINDFINKRCDLNTFCEQFKEPSIKYHRLNITKEKLYQYKETNEQENM